MAELLSITLWGAGWKRQRLDERQKVAHRYFKKVTQESNVGAIEKLAPIVGAREKDKVAAARELFPGGGGERDRARELLLKRLPGVTIALRAPDGTPAFPPDGKDIIKALGGRVCAAKSAEEILNAPAAAAGKWDDVIRCCVLGDNTTKGATKKKVYTCSSVNTMTTATKYQGRKSALQSNTRNDTTCTSRSW